MRNYRKTFFVLHVLVFCNLTTACTTTSQKTAFAEAARRPASSSAQYPLTFFSSPEDGHRPFINAIARAHKTIMIEMFHLNDTDVTDALAKLPANIEVSIILNWKELVKTPADKDLMDNLHQQNPHVNYFPSTHSYTLTHTKAMVVDAGTADGFALVSSMNLVKTETSGRGPHPVTRTRDYGVETHDPDLVNEMAAVFSADIDSSQHGGRGTPPLKPFDPYGNSLIWSDKTSRPGLIGLIAESEKITDPKQRYIKATVESIGDGDLEGALSHAKSNGVQVELLLPMCLEGFHIHDNYDLAGGMQNVLLHYGRKPYSRDQPYMHGKMIILGNGRGYIGSVNFSKTSMDGDRELGIIFTDMGIKNKLEALFDHDYPQAAPPTEPAVCKRE